MQAEPDLRTGGVRYALAAYAIWGTLPLYVALLRHVPPQVLVGWRAVFTLPVCFMLIAGMAWTGKPYWSRLLAVLRQPRLVGVLAFSALLIGSNWLIYVYAVQERHILATSVGYYINPLVNVLLGTLVLGERLSSRQWLAVGLAAIGVGMLAWGALDTMAISISLAMSFALYGLVRKMAPIDPLVALTVETMAMFPVAALALLLAPAGLPGLSLAQDPATGLMLAGAGVLTAVPLVLFGVAAQRMDYSAMGFIQFTTPTLAFLFGVFIFEEPLREAQVLCFAAIWAGIAVFVWDIIARKRAERA